METSDAFESLTCRSCGRGFDPERFAHRCPDCGGILDPTYDLNRIDLDGDTVQDRRFDSMWRYEELLPFPRQTAVTMDEGGTQLVDCPMLADEMEVGQVLIKDEGRNPTGTFKDRGQSVGVPAGREIRAKTGPRAAAGRGRRSAGD